MQGSRTLAEAGCRDRAERPAGCSGPRVAEAPAFWRGQPQTEVRIGHPATRGRAAAGGQERSALAVRTDGWSDHAQGHCVQPEGCAPAFARPPSLQGGLRTYSRQVQRANVGQAASH